MENNNAPYLERTNKGQVFVGSDVNIFICLSLASGLRLYAATKIKPNRTNMLKTATTHTGKSYKRGEFEKAAQDLTDLANHARAQPRTD
jgi:hypothetical protein